MTRAYPHPSRRHTPQWQNGLDPLQPSRHRPRISPGEACACARHEIVGRTALSEFAHDLLPSVRSCTGDVCVARCDVLELNRPTKFPWKSRASSVVEHAGEVALDVD